MTTTEFRFSVVICAYTEARWDALVEAVQSVQRQTLPAHEILVVIDHNPALFERAERQISGAKVLANHQARGLSGARNTGIAAARGDIIAFMDEDALADEQWLWQLSQGFMDSQVQGVGGAILPLWPTERPGWFPVEFDWVVGCSYRGMPEDAKPVRNLIGCNMAFRREVFAQVGDFRHGIGRIGTLPVGCEETELCIRLHQHNPQSILLYQPAAKVQHRVSPNRATWKYFYSRCYAEGLSKALVARLVGAGDGLASERSYTLRTLPQGVLNGLASTLTRRNPAGIASAAAISSGLAVTTLGYLKGTLLSRTTSLQDSLEPAKPSF
jgi:glycosyltransferase involved in cell wall biosynthesis